MIILNLTEETVLRVGGYTKSHTLARSNSMRSMVAAKKENEPRRQNGASS